MKQLLKFTPAIFFFAFLIIGLLHRGGISFQAHILWMILMLPAAISVFFLKKSDPESRTPPLLLGLILLLMLTFAAGWTYSGMRDFGLITITTLLGGLATLLITVELNISETTANKFLNALCVIAALLCLFGLGLYIFMPVDRLAATFMHLPYLTTSYPNALALFLLGALPHALLQLNRLRNKPWLIITVLITTGLLLTFSRSGLIMAIGIISTLLFLKKIKLEKKTALVILGIIGLTMTFQVLRPDNLGQNSFEDKLTLNSGEKAASVNERLGFWKGAIQIIKEQPIFGTGPDTFEYVYPQYQEVLLANSDHPHNMLLRQASEFGIPSALLLLALITYALWKLRHTYRINDLHLALGLGALAMFGHNLLDYNLNFTSNALVFFTFLGCIIGLTHLNNHHTVPKRALWIVLFLITGVMFAGGLYEAYQRTMIVQARSLTGQEAENKYAKIRPIFYEDAILLRVHNAIEMGNFKLAKSLLKDITHRNRNYAESYNLLSEIYLMEKNIPLAKANSIKALKLDPWNNLRYHFQKIQLIIDTKKQPNDVMRKFYESLLRDYLVLLRNNAHETVRSGNPKYAIKIAEALDLSTLKKELIEVAILEREKFTNRYNIPLSPL